MNFDESFTKVIPDGPIDNIPALARIMAWRQAII